MGQNLSSPGHELVNGADVPTNGTPSLSLDLSAVGFGKFPKSRYQLKNALFVSAMTDLSARSQFEAEDPRWSHIFNPEVLVELMEHPYSLSEFALRLIQNNPTSKNLIQLMEQVISNIRFTIKKKGPLPEHLVPQCCMATFLLSALMQYFFMFQTTDELRAQLGLSSTWPEVALQIQTTNKPEPKAIERLIDILITTISHPNDEIADMKFFAIELLLCLASAPMYRNTTNECVQDDIFLTYIFNQASVELQHSSLSSLAYDPAAAGQNVFSESIAVKLIKGLLQCSHGGVYILGQTAIQPTAGAESTAVQRTVQVFNQGGFLSNLQFRIISHRSGYDTDGDVIVSVSRFIMDLISKLPLLSRLAPANYAVPPEEIPDCDPFDESIVPDQIFPIHLLKDRAVQLLLLLVHQKGNGKPGQRAMNPFREVFNLLTDDSLLQDQSGGDIEMVQRPGGGALALNQIFIDFDIVISDLIKMLPNKEYVLVLYSFLQMHASFPEILKATGYAPNVLTACLQGLFEAAATPMDEMDIDTINHLYTLVICILILVQDHTYVDSIYTYTVQATYYKEISSLHLPILEVVLLVVLKVMNIVIYRISDQYLLSNLCAIAMNICVYIHKMNAYTAERVVKNIINMCKKITKEEVTQAVEEPVSLEQVEVAAEEGSARAKPLDWDLLRLGLTTLLHFSDTMLRAHLHDNLTFLYTLVSSQAHVCDFISNPKVLHFLADQSGSEGEPDVLHHATAVSDYTTTVASMNSSVVDDQVPAVRYCADIHKVVRRYMEKIEEHSRGNAHQEHVYLTPDQAMEILRTEVSGGHVNSAQSSGVAAAEDIETAPSTIHADRRSAHHKTHFTYQEAENAHDFFVPYIWTTILLSTPELPWNWELLSQGQQLAMSSTKGNA